MVNRGVRINPFLWFNSLTSRVENLFSTPQNFAGTASAVILPAPGKEVSALTEIKLKKGEPVERALRRLKKKVDREGTLKVIRSRRQYEKPSAVRRRKEKVARFSAMLAERYADE
jgi:small subunit ribosomal protein S21